MNKKGPILIIEDDDDDRVILAEAFANTKYPNELIYFLNGEDALTFLESSGVTPFIILSDIYMPKLDGFALRDKIRMDAKLQLRCIPYLYFSTSESQDDVINAYSVSVQGFFKKQNSIREMEKTLHTIMEYLQRCAVPNNFL